MQILRLKPNNPAEERILAYLQENASEELQTKIEVGAIIQIGEKYLLNLKDLTGFMKYAQEEARKLASKGEQSLCVDDATVFGWAIHYFEEDSIHGTLYNEDGTLYTPPKATPTTPIVPPKPKKKVEPEVANQQSFFDFGEMLPEEPEEEPVAEVEVEPEPEKKVSPLYERYLGLQEEYPDHIIVLRVGDFYEIYGKDAEQIAENMELTLVKREMGLDVPVPMIGFPYHRLDIYAERLGTYYNMAVVEPDGNVTLMELPPQVVPTVSLDRETGELHEVEIDFSHEIAYLEDKLRPFLKVML